jgi:hypothetical protein
MSGSGILFIQGSGYFLHDKMPGCDLPGLAAATALQFAA